MKKILLLTGCIAISHFAFSQATAPKTLTDSISLKVIHYLQTKQPDSIYTLVGEKFKSQLSKEDFENVTTNQILPLNSFQDVTFVKTSGGINKYKVTGTPDLQLLIGLDDSNMVETLLIQPFSDN